MGQAASYPAELTGREVATRLFSPATGSGEALDRRDGGGDRDFTGDLPDECLAHVFHFLGPGDRKRCSLVCKRWLCVDGQSRQRLSLEAKAEILPFLPAMFSRFDSVTKLVLRCDRKSVSLNDEGLVMISVRCSNLLRVKIRGCREITDLGLEAFARNCKKLKKFSCGSCNVGAHGLNAVLEHCKLLEDLSVRRLRGILRSTDQVQMRSSSVLRICLKELENGHAFEPLVAGSKTLKTLKIIRCLGDWDGVLEMIGDGNSSLSEIHLERLQVSDVGLSALSKCTNVETLHIVKTPCSNTGLISIAEKCKQLRKLHIDGWRTNRIGDDGLMAVAKHCLSLQELVLTGVKATHMSVAAIASNCSKLERLALCGIGTIGDAEIACIATKCGALRKFCIKGCPISDVGIEALAMGCPNLVRLKVKKCRVVTGEVGEWLREQRRSLVVSVDGNEPYAMVDANGGNGGVRVLEAVVEDHPTDQIADAEASSNVNNGGRLAMVRTRLGFLACRNLVACTLRRWSHGDDDSSTQQL
ncbi:PREDICTED: F-box protein SKIP2 [Tarenaya hassleriana]|uniref:F-box protein SKIP2 n=1 Tax=Tarenaya hassleriana TaxID=28532 RepID=UPI00053C8FB4|nr:PREDICTED: F-box protein SKIP2 [Tarenaya hassleriana]